MKISKLFSKWLNIFMFTSLACSIFATNISETVDYGRYGKVTITPFKNDWLIDYTNIASHISTEQLLHVVGLDGDGKGLTWHASKFATSDGMDARYNPATKMDSADKGGIQFRLPYFITPKQYIEAYHATDVSSEAKDILEVKDSNGNVINYRLFVHPEAFKYFSVLHDTPGISYVSSEKSEYIATPTSSYRSLVIRKINNHSKNSTNFSKESKPMIIKLGVSGSVLGADRWMSSREITRSITVQNLFSSLQNDIYASRTMKLIIFPETMGIFIPPDKIKNFPPDGEDKISGVLIREFPKKMFDEHLKIYSMAALMSVERLKKENKNIGSEDQIDDNFSQLPLIFKLIDAAKKKQLVSSTEEYVRKYLINSFLEIIDQLTFDEGIFIEPHSQNLCIVLDSEYIPIGFAYRDLGGVAIDLISRDLNNKDIFMLSDIYSPKAITYKSSMALENSYVKNYVWFYSYQVLNKLLNVLTDPGNDKNGNKIEIIPPPKGAPYQIGFDKPIMERNLTKYILDRLTSKKAAQKFKSMLMPFSKVNKLLYEFDKKYETMMNEYFALEKIQVKLIDDMLPNAEGGSAGEYLCKQHKGFLRNERNFHKLILRHTEYYPVKELLNSNILSIDELNRRTISSFKLNKGFKDLKINSFALDKQGLWFLDTDEKYIAFMPFEGTEERDLFYNFLKSKKKVVFQCSYSE